MNDLLHAIESCLLAEEHYGALVISLMIPSIAAAAAAQNNRDSEDKYIRWYDDNVADIRGFVGGDCYKLRCKLLHQGISAPDSRSGFQSIYTNFIFTLPNPQNNRAYGNQEIDTRTGAHTIDIELVTFANNIVSAGRAWLNNVRGDSRIQSNLLSTVQKRTYITPGIHLEGIEIIS